MKRKNVASLFDEAVVMTVHAWVMSQRLLKRLIFMCDGSLQAS